MDDSPPLPDLTAPIAAAAAPLQALHRVTDALRSRPDPTDLAGAYAAVMRGLTNTPAAHCAIWHISLDGTRMRPALDTTSGASGRDVRSPGPWRAADGPIAQVLGARRPIEMAILDPDLVPGASGPPLGRVEAGDDIRRPNRPFGRFLPIRQAVAGAADRIVAVLGVVRSAGSAVFDSNDRHMLDTVAERLEVAVALQRTSDDLAGERSRRLVHGQGVIIGDELLAKLGAIGGDIVFRHLFAGGTDYISGGVATSLGYTPEEVMSDAGLIDRLVHPDDRHLLTDLIDDPSLANRPIQIRMLRRNGKLSWQLVRVLPVTDASGRVLGIEGLSTDVTAMKMAEAELAHQARSDSLTGLANRLNFREATARALARIERHNGMTGILFLDLDGFKAVNDRFGHAAGDAVLLQVAERLRRVIRREDLVARLGGDEFAVLLAEIRDVGEAEATARRILVALDDQLEVDGLPAGVSTGIGIAVTRTGSITPDELVNRSDIALYQAKRAGRGRWQVYEGPNGTAVMSQPTLLDDDAIAPGHPISGASANPSSNRRPAVSEESIRAALEREELRVHFLPELDSITGAVVAVEALVRWQHPDLGLVSAEYFVPEADALDLLPLIGDWVLRAAARQVMLWRSDFDTPLRLWVNVSVAQLARPDFADVLLTTLASVGLAPRDLGLELSERALATLDPVAEAVLDTLHRAGVRLAIDGFGTGSSSLRTLRRLPLSQIKLDRSLVAIVDVVVDAADMSRSADIDASVRTSVDVELVPLAIKLAQSLGADVVAVGVERPAQIERLRVLRCQYFQGLLVGGPRSARELTDMLVAGQFTLPEEPDAHPAPASDSPETERP